MIVNHASIPLFSTDELPAHANASMYPKHWMPLTEFSECAMDGLIKGDEYVAIGTAKVQFERFEKPKLAVITQILGALKQMSSDSGD